MKIEYKKTKNNNIVQVTTIDERHYYDNEKDIFAPSSTWIASYFPKGIAFYKWLANKGWDEAQAIKEAAGNKGSKIHQAIEQLETFGEIRMEEKFFNSSKNEHEELSIEEWEAIMSFYDWWLETQPELILSEQVVWYKDSEMEYAGTLDRVYRIDGKIVLLDFKTGQDIWTEGEIQISSYLPALFQTHNIQADELAILQIGYKRNKRGWKYNVIENKFDLFRNVYQIWKHDNPKDKILQKDYPQIIKLNKKEK